MIVINERMNASTELILIRHGETEWNLSGRWQGHADSPLSDRGIAQAEALGKRLKTADFDFFYSSDENYFSFYFVRILSLSLY